MQLKLIFGSIVMSLILFGCSPETNTVQQAQKDDKLIKTYLKAHNIQAKKTENGIYYVVTKEGNGAQPERSDTVSVRYKGYTLDGKVFDKSGAEAITLYLGGVIIGWTLGIPHFKEGGSGKLFIPSRWAYGTEGNRVIAPNTVLVFDIDLIDIVHKK